MRLALLPLTLTSVAVAQTPTNLFDIYSGCTNYTARGAIGNNAGELLMQVSSTHFGGVCQDSTGTATSLTGFQYVTQDQSGVTPETYYMVVRGDNSGAPDTSATGLLLRAGPLTTPASTVTTPVAWVITATLATPTTTVPLCSTFYHGSEVAAAPGWSGNTDGQSFHICTYYLLGATQADNPAPQAPNLAWDVVNGVPTQPGSAWCIRFGLLAPSAMLKLGNNDPTLANAANCVTTLSNISFGAGGIFPQAQGAAGPRNDGLNFRVRDAANPNGVAVVFLGQNLGCPGLSLSGIANGALYLNPGGIFVQLATGTMDPTGLSTGPLIPASPAVRSAVNRVIDFQAFTLSSSFTLPGNLTNRASVAYRL
jgi:hypothetical protein